MPDGTVTRAEAAREVGADPKSIGTLLRARYGKLSPGATRWHLTPVQVRFIRERFIAK